MNLKFIILRIESKEVIAYRSKVYVSQKQEVEIILKYIRIQELVETGSQEDLNLIEITRKIILKSSQATRLVTEDNNMILGAVCFLLGF